MRCDLVGLIHLYEQESGVRWFEERGGWCDYKWGENVIKMNSSEATTGEFLTLKWSQKNRDWIGIIQRTNEWWQWRWSRWWRWQWWWRRWWWCSPCPPSATCTPPPCCPQGRSVWKRRNQDYISIMRWQFWELEVTEKIILDMLMGLCGGHKERGQEGNGEQSDG